MVGTTAFEITGPMRLSYGTDRFLFRECVTAMLGGEELESLTAPVARLEQATDQSTVFHKRFYEQFKVMVPAYEDFLAEWVKPIFQESIVYQRVPTFRIQLRENLAVGSWHRDSDFGHAEYEMNFWLPFTDAYASNTVWIEQGETYKAHSVEYGEVLVFPGATLMHGNVPNLTGQTRVSMDFRAYPARLHRDREDTTVSAGRKFKIGDYWAGPV